MMREPQNKDAIGTVVQFTLRELRAYFSRPTVWIGIVAVSLLLGISGPFNTFELLPFGLRLAYWLMIAVVTFLVGSFTLQLSQNLLLAQAWPTLAKRAVSALAGVATITPVVIGVNALAFPSPVGQAEAMDWEIWAYTALVTFMICWIILSLPKATSSQALAPTQATAPAILLRLKLENRGALISLSVSDHYVEVTTSRGSELILMRLADAIAETAPAEGLQIHRSHWVALDAITTANRKDGRVFLTLSSGATLPVSRSNLNAIKAAGILPQ